MQTWEEGVRAPHILPTPLPRKKANYLVKRHLIKHNLKDPTWFFPKPKYPRYYELISDNILVVKKVLFLKSYKQFVSIFCSLLKKMSSKPLDNDRAGHEGDDLLVRLRRQNLRVRRQLHLHRRLPKDVSHQSNKVHLITSEKIKKKDLYNLKLIGSTNV